MSAEPVRSTRCPNCARLLGKQQVPSGHTNCPAVHITKCGKCNAVVIVPMDPTKPATTL